MISEPEKPDVVSFQADAGAGGSSSAQGVAPKSADGARSVQEKPRKSAKGVLFGCLGLFFVLFLLGLAFLIIMLVQNPTQNPVLEQLGVEPALFKNVLNSLVLFVFGSLSIISLIVVLYGAFRRFAATKQETQLRKQSLIMMVTGLIFGVFSFFLLIVLSYAVSRIQVGVSGPLAILSDPADTVNLTAPQEVLFSAQNISARYNREGVVSYSWDLDGDGQYDDGNGLEIRYTYTNKGKNDGTFLIGLEVLLQSGRRLNFEKVLSIANIRPQASIRFTPESPRAGEQVRFDASASKDPDGTIVSYQWDFDDNEQEDSSTPVAEWTFDTFGEKKVLLVLVDNNGEELREELLVEVREPERKEVLIQAVPGLVGEAPFEVTLDGSKSFVGATIKDFRWDFGDNSLGDRGRRVVHRYERVGDYEVTLSISDENDQVYEGKVRIQVKKQIQPPEARIRVSGAEVSNNLAYGQAPLRLQFHASESLDRDGGITEYRWDLDGDSVIDDYGVNAEYTFIEEGEYEVRLIVVDDDGLEGSSVLRVQVERPNIRLSVLADPDAGSVPLEVSFDASGTSISEGKIASYRWNFGDGSGEVLAGAKQVHLYDQVGIYRVSVTAISDSGEESSLTLQVVVRDVELQAQFQFNPSQPKSGQKIFFDASGSIGNIQRFFWNFGDGDISRLTKPEHIYPAPGNYSVKLEVFDHQNNKSELIKDVTVE